jgi:hypothetical protein
MMIALCWLSMEIVIRECVVCMGVNGVWCVCGVHFINNKISIDFLTFVEYFIFYLTENENMW